MSRDRIDPMRRLLALRERRIDALASELAHARNALAAAQVVRDRAAFELRSARCRLSELHEWAAREPSELARWIMTFNARRQALHEQMLAAAGADSEAEHALQSARDAHREVGARLVRAHARRNALHTRLKQWLALRAAAHEALEADEATAVPARRAPPGSARTATFSTRPHG